MSMMSRGDTLPAISAAQRATADSIDLAGHTPSRYLSTSNKLDFEMNPFEHSFSQVTPTVMDGAGYSGSSIDGPSSSTAPPVPGQQPANSQSTSAAPVMFGVRGMTANLDLPPPPPIIADKDRWSLAGATSTVGSQLNKPGGGTLTPLPVLPPAAAIDSPNPCISAVAPTFTANFGWDSLRFGPLSPSLLHGPKGANATTPAGGTQRLGTRSISANAAAGHPSSQLPPQHGRSTVAAAALTASQRSLPVDGLASAVPTMTPSHLRLSDNHLPVDASSSGVPASVGPTMSVTATDTVPLAARQRHQQQAQTQQESSNMIMAAAAAAAAIAGQSELAQRGSVPSVNELLANAPPLTPITKALFVAAQEQASIKQEDGVKAAIAAATASDNLIFTGTATHQPSAAAQPSRDAIINYNVASIPAAGSTSAINSMPLPPPSTMLQSDPTQLHANQASLINQLNNIHPLVPQQSQHMSMAAAPQPNYALPTGSVLMHTQPTQQQQRTPSTRKKAMPTKPASSTGKTKKNAATPNDKSTTKQPPAKRQRTPRTKDLHIPTGFQVKVTATPPLHSPASSGDASAANGAEHAVSDGRRNSRRQAIDRRRIPKVNLDHLPVDEREKRKGFLERNRVAALKCRQRKKAWLQELQARIDTASSENDQLQQQAVSLREEIINLKALMLAHKDCPIARANGLNSAAAVNQVSANAAALAASSDLNRILAEAGLPVVTVPESAMAAHRYHQNSAETSSELVPPPSAFAAAQPHLSTVAVNKAPSNGATDMYQPAVIFTPQLGAATIAPSNGNPTTGVLGQMPSYLADTLPRVAVAATSNPSIPQHHY